MKTVVGVSVLVAIVASWGAPTHASVLYDNGLPDLTAAFFSDYDDYGEQIAENFFGFTGNSGSATITGIQWYGLYWGDTPPAEDDFTISFYTEESGSRPAFSSFHTVDAGSAFRADTGIDFVSESGRSYDVYTYWSNIDNVSLMLGGRYYLSIVDDSGPYEADDWLWCTSAYEGGSMWYRFGVDMWTYSNSDMAFTLYGDYNHVIPEPATFTLLTLGIAGALVRRFRWRR